MKPNLDKIDAAVLALLHLTSFTEGNGGLREPPGLGKDTTGTP
jgi:hypothetical protein